MTAPAPQLSVLPSRLPTVPALPDEEQLAAALDGKAAPSDVQEIVWLRAEARRRGLTTFAAIGELIKKDRTVISRCFDGSYASISTVAAHIRSFREEHAAMNPDEEPFVEGLSIVQDIVPFCDMARVTQQVAIIWGENQSGKSRTLQHYAENHSDTVLLRMPAGGGTKKTMEELANVCGISSRKSDEELRERIIRRFTSSSLLIVDEFHQAVNGRSIRTVTVDRIREIHDLCKCGLVLCGTHVVAEMIEDTRFARFLGQVDNRGALQLNIPKAPTRADRVLLCKAYGLGLPDRDTARLVNEICDKHGIARLTDYFKIARRLAIKGGKPLGWEHFNLTHTTLKAWASGVRAKED